MKKLLPLVLGALAGWIMVVDLFVPRHEVGWTKEQLLEWGQILAASALVLGGINLLQVNLPKIRRRDDDWQYKIVLLAGAAIMFAFGLPWHKIGDDPQPGAVTIEAGPAGATTARLRIEASRDSAVVKIDELPAQAARPGGKPLEVELTPGEHKVYVSMSEVGYEELRATFTVAAGQTAVARAELPMLFGKDGRLRTWVYNYVFFPCNSTMFALLAFFIASAAFRAFRARNTEAALLLGAAIIVLLGRAPIGSVLWEDLPAVTDWIIAFPNNAGRRAIIMGAALGAIVTGLRVLLGLERQHLGAD